MKSRATTQYESALKKIITGIKTTINGQYGIIDINGEYEASIHIFLSITPDARHNSK